MKSRLSIRTNNIIVRLLLLLCIVIPSPLLAAISVVGSADTGGSVTEDTTITRSWTSTTGTNSMLVVFIPYYNDPGSVVVSSVTWGGTPLTRLSSSPGSPTGDTVIGEIWGLALGASHTGATNNVVVTFSGNAYCNTIIQQFDGVNQTTPSHDGAREPTTESGTAAISIANVASTDYILGTFTKYNSANTYTPSNSATTIYQGNISGLTTRRVLAIYRTGVTGTQNIGATFTSTYHGGAGVALQEAAGGGGSTCNGALMLLRSGGC